MSATACQVIPKGISFSAHLDILECISKGMNAGKAIKRIIKGLSSSEIENYSYSYSYRLCFAFSADDMQQVYERGPTSCMAGSEDVRFYAHSNGKVAVAYVTDSVGDIAARTLVRVDKLVYLKLYGESCYTKALSALLTNIGYTLDPAHFWDDVEFNIPVVTFIETKYKTVEIKEYVAYRDMSQHNKDIYLNYDSRAALRNTVFISDYPVSLYYAATKLYRQVLEKLADFEGKTVSQLCEDRGYNTEGGMHNMHVVLVSRVNISDGLYLDIRHSRLNGQHIYEPVLWISNYRQIPRKVKLWEPNSVKTGFSYFPYFDYCDKVEHKNIENKLKVTLNSEKETKGEEIDFYSLEKLLSKRSKAKGIRKFKTR